MTIKNKRKRFAAGVGALALSVGTLGLGAAASADDALNVGPDQPNAPANNSLTIHKRAGAEATTSNGGKEIENAPGQPVKGVEFTVWQLGNKNAADECVAVDLADTTQWANIPTGTAPASIDDVTGFCVVEQVAKTTTDVNGEIKLPNVDKSLYYVAETSVAGATINGKPANITEHALPFYVTVPLPYATGTTPDRTTDWIYDVHAYPKNQTTEVPSKTVNETTDQTGYKVGDTVQYKISQTVPTPKNADGVFTQASLYDNLGTDLGYGSTVSVKVNGNEIAAGVNGYELVQNGNVVSWELKGDALKNLKSGDTLEVVFKATVKNVTSTGEIANPGSDMTKPGYGSSFDDTKKPGEVTPYTYWGQRKVTKVDENTKPLKGAEFKVTAKGTAACADTVGSQDVVSTGTSGTDGIVTWDFTDPASSPLGLFVANSSNGPLTDPSKDYCLYETKVPAGYTGATVKTVNIKAGTTNITELDVKNIQKDGPDLPLTGAQGTLLMVVGGLVLVAAGTGAVVATRKRQAAQD